MVSTKSAVVPLLCIILVLRVFGFLYDADRNGQPRIEFDWLCSKFLLAVVNPQLVLAFTYISCYGKWGVVFISLFLFRYVRLFVNIIGFIAYRPTPLPKDPTLTSKNVSVIVPTIDSGSPDFGECIASLVANNPADIIVVTAGGINMFERATRYQQIYPNITVLASKKANKRAQICLGLEHVRTAITVLCDDHVFWPTTFLAALLAPFESRSVGAVGTNKRVRRTSTGLSWTSFWNFLGCLYLERHNFEIAATNYLDGGVFCISGRTAAYRSSILKDPNFVQGFRNEYTFFGLVGPLNSDDDNFITRWCVNHGWRIKIQYSEESMIETTLGTYPKYLSQCLRWVRTTWRSNPTSLFADRTVWRAQPWCAYAVYLSSLVNFALFYDAALVWTLYCALSDSANQNGNIPTWMICLGLWMLASKLVKPFPHFWRNPKDLLFLPGYILFSYYHSLIKLYAMFTFWDVAWSGRPSLAAEA